MYSYSSIDSKEDLAANIGVTVKQITGILYGIGIDKYYHTFFIPKKEWSTKTNKCPNWQSEICSKETKRIAFKATR